MHVDLYRDAIPDSETHPFNLPAIRHLTSLTLHPKVTFLIGENGTGKSTLLEAMAVASGLNPEGGSRNFNFATREDHTSLDRYVHLVRSPARPRDCYFLRAESFYNVASEIERLDEDNAPAPPIINAYGGTSLHAQSHGESFFSLFRHRFGDHGLYFMDEPEAALSPNRQIQFLALLHDFVQRGGQFVIATHSPIIMAYPDARIYHLNADGITMLDYTKTEHYRITRGFLDNHERTLAMLFADDAPPDPHDRG